MNQQAGPSIILSVLIVGFFGVALFPRGPSRTRGSAEAAQTAETVPSSQPGADLARLTPPHSEPSAGHVPAPAKNAVKTGAPIGDESPRLVVNPSISAAPTSGRAVIRQASKSSIRPGPESQLAGAVTALPVRPARPTNPRRPSPLSAPRRRSQTWPCRVHGTATRADALWRANRDALPRRDSPLVPGTLLRTPTVR